MKKWKTLKASIVTVAILGGTVHAEAGYKSFWDRLLLEGGANALWPMKSVYSSGGGGGIGIALRDFNVLFHVSGLVTDPGLDQKTAIIPKIRLEGKLGIFTNLLTLMPYVDFGNISRKITRFDGQSSGTITTLYTEAGVGAEIPVTHEISIIPRLGAAYALLYDTPDASNQSGLSASVSVRYTFGRNRGLDY